MGTSVRQIQRFLATLKRRNVYKVATAYTTAAFVTVEAVDIIFPPASPRTATKGRNGSF